jgi:hypothetical protein
MYDTRPIPRDTSPGNRLLQRGEPGSGSTTLFAGAALPSPLRGSVVSAGNAGLGMNLLRRTQPCLNSKNEKGPRKGALYSFW